MAIRTLPSDTKIRSISWQLLTPAQVNRSRYTGARKVMGLPGGARWTAQVELVPFNSDATAAPWRGFLASLEGQVHTFYLPALDEQHTATNPTCTASAGAGTVTLSAAIGLKAGQHMTFTLTSGKKQMVVLIADMVGTSATFAPLLRGNVSGAVETKAPYCEVALDAATVGWLSTPARMFEFPVFGVEEAY